MNDTNIITALMNALANKPESNSNSQTLLIMTMIIATVAPLLQAIINFVNSRALSAKIEESRIVNDETAKTVSSIKVDTNHDRVVMMEELRKLRESTTALTTRNAILEEQKHSGEMIKASIPVINNPGTFTDAQLDQITRVLRDIKKPEPIEAKIVGPAPLPVTVIKT